MIQQEMTKKASDEKLWLENQPGCQGYNLNCHHNNTLNQIKNIWPCRITFTILLTKGFKMCQKLTVKQVEQAQ